MSNLKGGGTNSCEDTCWLDQDETKAIRDTGEPCQSYQVCSPTQGHCPSAVC